MAANKLTARKRYILLRDLAEGALTYDAMAEKHGLSNKSSVAHYAKHYAEEIAAMRENLEDEWAGIWVADKKKRIQEYQAIVEEIEEDLRVNGQDTGLQRARMTALKSIAEELGQLPSRVVIRQVGQKADYSLDGVDFDDLV
jgi:hypothetical protein